MYEDFKNENLEEKANNQTEEQTINNASTTQSFESEQPTIENVTETQSFESEQPTIENVTETQSVENEQPTIENVVETQQVESEQQDSSVEDPTETVSTDAILTDSINSAYQLSIDSSVEVNNVARLARNDYVEDELDRKPTPLLDDILSKVIESERNILSNDDFYNTELDEKIAVKKTTKENYKKEFYEYLRNQSKYKF